MHTIGREGQKPRQQVSWWETVSLKKAVLPLGKHGLNPHVVNFVHVIYHSLKDISHLL